MQGNGHTPPRSIIQYILRSRHIRRRLLLACAVSPYHFASSCRDLPLALLHVSLRSHRDTFCPLRRPTINAIDREGHGVGVLAHSNS